MKVLNNYTLRKIKAISDYQFGPKITDILFKNEDTINFQYSKNTGRIKHVLSDNDLILNFRPNIGLFTLTLNSALSIIKAIPSPTLRAVVLNEISEFIKKGRNVFCKHIVDIDSDLRAFDEIVVVNQKGELLGIGKIMLPIPYIKSFTTGLAIKIRKGVNKSNI
jgi:predicted RNA-binding protein (TIGR00451 family)